MPTAPNDAHITAIPYPRPISNARRGLLVAAFALLGLCIFLLYSNYRYQPQEPVTEQVEPFVPTRRAVLAPLILPPAATLTIPEVRVSLDFAHPGAEPLPQLPPYAQARPFIIEQLALERWQALGLKPENVTGLNKEFLLQRSVAFLHGLSKGRIIDKLLPFARPAETFVVDKQGASLAMGAKNFQRYDAFTQGIIAIDTAQAAAFFHWTRPLLETAYSELGYPASALDTALLEAIDSLLATPTIEGAIALQRKSALYRYADPGLEALPPAQKQLIRMGSHNASLLQRWLGELRQALVAPRRS
ncbi:hypothetical protein A9Q89_03365 [Gammaproteobacteria bacterium 53_120_T64]|nr:hypothetical protein A9Q89_03365 [Gammaproteobacteria bacterium 53_120_T64]